jgi:hypothetical protein
VNGNPSNWWDPMGLDVTNESNEPIVVKPESDSKKPFVVGPGEKWPGKQDGIYVNDRPYKSVDGVNLTVKKDGTVEAETKGLKQTVGQWAIGGEKSRRWLNQKEVQNWPCMDEVRKLIDEWKKKNAACDKNDARSEADESPAKKPQTPMEKPAEDKVGGK